MQERARFERFHLSFAESENATHFHRVNLRAADVPVCRLIFGVNGDGERLDGVHVKFGHLFDVAHRVGFSAPDLIPALFVEEIKKMNNRNDQQTDEKKRDAPAFPCDEE